MSDEITLEVKPVDAEFYAERLKDFLPARIVDVHTHVWTGDAAGDATAASRVVSWPGLVADRNPVEHLVETYRRVLPGKSVSAWVFGSPSDLKTVDAMNVYASGAAAPHGLTALALVRPDWSAEVLEQKLDEGHFVGVKPYLTFADAKIKADEIGIFDFLPAHQWEALNRRQSIVILHIPRAGRLRDPKNLADLRRIDAEHPDAQVVVAHVGRAYCDEDVGGAMEVLSATRNLRFDISANTNANVFGRLIDTVGPKRIVFGSDLPITRMRMRRITENGVYVNIVPRGLYGDVSGDVHMREAGGPEADRLTFFLYEEIDAFRRAAEACGLTRDDVEDVFCRNAERMLERAMRR